MQDFDRIRSFILSYGKDEDGQLGSIYSDAISRGVPVIRPDMKELLRLLLLLKKPEHILEIGTAVGFSALFMSENRPEAKITTMELDPDRAAEAKKNIREASKEDRIRVLEGDAAELLGSPDSWFDGPYDLIFIDAAKAQYKEYFEKARLLAAPEGMIVSDNVLQDGSIMESHFLVEKRDRTIHDRMREYLKMLTGTPGLTTDILPVGDGVAISVLKGMK